MPGVVPDGGLLELPGEAGLLPRQVAPLPWIRGKVVHLDHLQPCQLLGLKQKHYKNDCGRRRTLRRTEWRHNLCRASSLCRILRRDI